MNEQKDLAVGRTISLRLSEWARLHELSPVGSATREATEIIRRHLQRLTEEKESSHD